MSGPGVWEENSEVGPDSGDQYHSSDWSNGWTHQVKLDSIRLRDNGVGLSVGHNQGSRLCWSNLDG